MWLPEQLGLMFLAGVAAAGLNSVAGGGSFVSVPALIFLGLDPVRANATSTLSLWMAWLSTGTAFRKELAGTRALLSRFIVPGALGGVVGAFILVRTPSHVFERLFPWLLFLATLVFAFGDRLRQVAGSNAAHHPEPLSAASPGRRLLLGVTMGAVALYAGYFGGGTGFLVLALLSLHGMTELHQMNAIKSALAILINSFALVTLMITGTIDWIPGVCMGLGGLVGGYLGPLLARRIRPVLLRRVVVGVGLLMTVVFVVRAYSPN